MKTNYLIHAFIHSLTLKKYRTYAIYYIMKVHRHFSSWTVPNWEQQKILAYGDEHGDGNNVVVF